MASSSSSLSAAVRALALAAAAAALAPAPAAAASPARGPAAATVRLVVQLRPDAGGAAASAALHGPGVAVTATAGARSLLAVDRAALAPTLFGLRTSAAVASVRLASSQGSPPANLTPPTIAGTPQVGQTLAADPGTWTGADVLAYQWLRDGSPIADATAQSYELVPDDVGARISVRVTATGGGGSTDAVSAATAPVSASPPVLGSPPRINGSAHVHQVLEADPGTWSYADTLAYQWFRGAAAIVGATADTYELVSADLGGYVSIRVTATGPGGTTVARSDGLGPVKVAAPELVDPPVVSGSAQVGQTLHATAGSWTGADSFAYQWLRDGAPIAGATTTAHVVVAGDHGAHLAFQVTASNDGGATVAVSDPTDPAVHAAPVKLSSPVVSGTAQAGQTVHASPGDWTDADGFDYQWLADGSPIDGATASDYEAQRADMGARLSVQVTANGDGGSTVAVSASTAAVIAPAPSVEVAPSFDGLTQVGETLTADPGTWLDATSCSYQWLRGGEPVVNAVGSEYLVHVADFGAQLSVRVTASGPGGSTAAVSDAQGPVTELPPANTELPAIRGVAKVGRTLDSDSGTWTDAQSFAYQWLRNGEPIDGATTGSHRLVADDEGTSISLRVTATGLGGQAEAVSDATDVVVPPTPPAVDTPPSASAAHVRDGSLVTADAGVWEDADWFTYQWLRDGDPVDGATDETYLLSAVDIDHLVSVEVTAHGAGGTASATSDEIGPVVPLPPPPSLITAPSVSGTAKTGYTLTAAPGTWTDTDSYEYRWLRCDATGKNCAPLEDTDSTYTSVGADAGHRIGVHVTAVGAGGSTGADAAPLGPIALSAAPRATKPPAVTGETQIGFTLSGTNGTWANVVSGYAYQWLRCDRAGKNCAPIADATVSTYEVTAPDLGQKLGLRVTATGPGGGTGSESSKVGPVAVASLPTSLSAPTVSGIAQTGWTLTSTTGRWRFALGPVAYQWLRCDKAGKNCAAIDGETASTYLLGPDDLAQRIGVRVTATGPGGSRSADSGKTAAIVVPLPPSATGRPALSGITQVGWTLTGTTGAWRFANAPFTYQWLRCDTAGKNCVPIADATASGYTLTTDDLVARLVLRVTGSGPGGSATADSAASAAVAVALPPALIAKPAISGRTTAGSKLTATSGRWRYAVTYGYQWLRCDALGKSCAPVDGATATTYTVVDADRGGRLAVRVTATGPGGSASSDSPASGAVPR